eukprot:scaffold13881_cov124-Isochrysis_galbana.AAC.11
MGLSLKAEGLAAAAAASHLFIDTDTFLTQPSIQVLSPTYAYALTPYLSIYMAEATNQNSHVIALSKRAREPFGGMLAIWPEARY